MTCWNIKWILALFIFIAIVQAQNKETEEDTDWIPITPSTIEAESRSAQGRVLNLDATNQKFISDYRKRNPQPSSNSDQYLRETSQQSRPLRPQKIYQEPYKFEVVSSSPPIKSQFALPQYAQSQYQQFAEQPQLPLQVQQVLSGEVPPENYYSKDQHQFDIPINQSFYESVLKPGSINQQQFAENIKKQLKPQEEKESVQLLYVPLENLNQNHPLLPQPSQQVFQRQEKQVPTRGQKVTLDNIENDFIHQALAAHKLQEQFQLDQQPILIPTSTTTQRPISKKRKPHQPPLAVFMEKVGQADVKEVLDALKNAKSIAVQDSVGPNSPSVFVGPSTLHTEGYAKFPLPYLSSLESNRIERKVDELPFFVAPLSYRTPDGYSKIPLPSPHVGSVVINTNQKIHKNDQTFRPTQITPNELSFDIKENAYLNNLTPNQYQNQNYQEDDRNYNVNYQPRPQVQQQYLPNYLLNSQQLGQADIQSVTPKSQENIFNYSEQQQKVVQISTEKAPVRKIVPSQPAYLNYNKEQQVHDYTTENILNQYQQQQISTEKAPVRTIVPSKPIYLSFNKEQQVRDYTTENILNQYQQQEFQPSENTRQNPLQQYELHQINEFIEDGIPQPTKTSTPSESINYDFTTPRAIRQRQRGKKPAISTTSTLRPSLNDQTEKYTVLEEFSVKPAPQPNKYTTTVETIPAKVYKLSSEQIQPNIYEQQQTEQPELKQHVLNQDMLDEQILHSSRGQLKTTPRPLNNYPSSTTLLYDSVPEREVYKQANDNLQFDSQPYQTAQRQQPVAQEAPQLYKVSVSQRPLLQDELSQYNKATEQTIQQQQPQFVYETSSQSQDNSHLPSLLFNRGQELETTRQSEINPFLPGLINSLQDEGVKQLLVPNLLVPTTEKQAQLNLVTSTTEKVQTETPKLETTTIKRTRGRQRGSTIGRYSSTTTAAPRTRAVNRRRPAPTRTTTVRVLVDDSDETTKKSTVLSQQRFRTRGRPSQSLATERVLTENFKVPNLESGFQASSGEPQSYMQFEHTIDNQEVITAKPGYNEEKSRDYHQVYNIPVQSQLTSVVNSSPGSVVDIQITHPTTARSSTIQRNEETTKAPAKTRGRTRIRSRPTTVKSTSTSTTEATAKENNSDEYYGFIRQPNFNRASVQVQHNEPEQVTFVGEIRPKYNPTTPESVVVPSSEASRFKTRGRVRPPTRQQQTNDVKNSEEQSSRRTVSRTRGRGNTHYRNNDNRKNNDDDDVAGGNYPAPYLKARQELTTQKSHNFQITVDPESDQVADDQEGQLSLYRPKILPNPNTEWVEASILPPLNDLPMEDKAMKVDFGSNEQANTEEAEQPFTEELPTSAQTEQEEEAFETTTTQRNKEGRKRGVWKLVKQRPLDQFAIAESQNYQSVLNSFDRIIKETKEPTKESENSNKESIFDTLYNMFGMNDNTDDNEQLNITTTMSSKEDDFTTTLSPTFSSEYTEQTTNVQHLLTEPTELPDATTIAQTFKDYEVEPWEMKQMKTSTSTSTEVSSETEICYKGRCIKSKDKKKL